MLSAEPNWLIQVGDDTAQTVSASLVVPDGGAIVAMRYEGTVDLAPGATEHLLTAPAGERQDVLVRYNADGDLVWAKPFEKLGDSEAGNNSIRFDALQLSAGGIYAVGRFDGLVDFEPGGNADSIGDARAFDLGKAFVARFDLSTGALNWLYDVSATSASGQTDYYVAHDLAVDSNGTAYFSFDSSSMNTSLASNNISVTFAGNNFTNSEGFFQQAWVAKIDASGTIERIQRFGSYDALHNFGAGAGLEIAVDDSSPSEADWRLIVAAAAAGEVYLGDAVALSAETRIGTPAPNAAADQGFYDADLLLMSMTTNGELDWFRFDGGAGRQSAEDVFVNGNGDTYVDAGSFFWGKSSPGDDPLSLAGVDDPLEDFILRVNRDGSFESAANTFGKLLDVTDAGALLEVSATVPQAVGGLLLTPTPAGSRYLLQLDPTFITATPLLIHGSSLSGLAINSDDSITAAGSFSGTQVSLPGDVVVDSNGSSDIYVLNVALPSSPTLPAAELAVAFEDSFETGSNANNWSGNWVEDAQNDWFRSTQRSAIGRYSAEVDGLASDATLTMAQSVDLSSFARATLSFQWYIESGFDTGEYVAADVWDGASWVEVRRISGNESLENAWLSVNLNLEPELLTADFRVRFRSLVSASAEDANVDNVRIWGVMPIGAPNQAPTSNAGGPYSGNEDAAVLFDAAGSSDPDGDALTYEWDFGDGTIRTTHVPTISHTYSYGGNFVASLRVTDGRGGVDASTVNVTIAEVNDAPIAEVSGPSQVRVDEAFALDASGSTDFDNLDQTPLNDQALTYTFDFGDGSAPVSSSSPLITHTYAAAGTYTATVTVSDGIVESAPTEISIMVDPPPTGSANDLYLWDISFETFRFWRTNYVRITVQAKSDSDADGVSSGADAGASGASLQLQIRDASGAVAGTLSGTTNSQGTFRTGWLRLGNSSSYSANVTDLALAGFTWNRALDNEDDSDGDGWPDNGFSF